MRWDISPDVKENSFDYFEKTLITENGFREYDVRWRLGSEINPNGFFVLGCAYGTMARNILKSDRVVVGYDFRSYSQDLSRSLILGLLSTGVHVIDIGLALSPMLYFAQHHFNCAAGVEVTASHNENGWTGLKLADGLSSTLGPEGIERFKKIVYSGEYASGCGTFEAFDGNYDAYKQDILKGFTLEDPFKIVLSAGNGTAGRFAPAIFKEMGCEVVELDCDPDWNFPKNNPNPESISFLREMIAATKANGADLGIGIDGDGDRIGVIDDRGRNIFSDKLGLLVARWLSLHYPERAVVIDVKSTGLFYDDAVLSENGMEVITWKTGHSYIKSKVAEQNAIAGFEKSGHWFFAKPIGRGYDDAVLSGVMLLKMISEMKKPLSAMVDGLPKTWQSPTMSVFCPDDKKYAVVDTMIRAYTEDEKAGALIGGEKIEKLITVNGVRFVLEDKSWGLVRASSNKPSLVIVAESRISEDQVRTIIDHIKERLEKTGQVGDYDQEMQIL